MTSEQTKAHIAALVAEREHYVRYNMPERAAQVDAQLASFGAKGKSPAKRAETMVAAKGTEV